MQKEEDLKLFSKIAAEIEERRQYYRSACEWVNTYCSEQAYWQRRQSKLDKIQGEYKKPPAPGRKSDIQDLKIRLTKKEPVGHTSLLIDAVGFFLEKKSEPLRIDDCKKVLVIVWILTDPDIDVRNLGVVKFERWKWIEEPEGVDRHFAYDWIFALDGWMSLVRYAWDKVDVERKPQFKKPTEPEQGSKGKRGRKKDPKVRTRNKKIADYRVLNSKLTWEEIGLKFNVSADIARKACNNPAN